MWIQVFPLGRSPRTMVLDGVVRAFSPVRSLRAVSRGRCARRFPVARQPRRHVVLTLWTLAILTGVSVGSWCCASHFADDTQHGTSFLDCHVLDCRVP